MDTDTFSLIVLLPALAFVCGSDLLYRRIHNLLILLLLALWLVLPACAPFGLGPWAELGSAELFQRMARSLLGALLVLLVGYGLFRLGRVGAGDVKLMAVICLWMGQDKQMTFLIVTALAGGLLALALPLLIPLETALARIWQRAAQSCPRLSLAVPTVLTDQRPAGIPYGLAIVAGALYTLFGPIHS
ncbi:prepilin peptidase [Phytopseudomonas dryadis]|uniref:Peptidase A24 n=1 Tax=Phytopseudomonas dryadis TaxID=2487520 RepID=A0A4Q9QY05_9GAMM|nr:MULTISPECIES: prepilin peptidase [Pseudomonas]TBU90024.1 peptidase A24 [Pseudomonas dryadis]TBV02660.1 peptidase A24 [Pseudomonas dryadis]TBV15512.1 peptidase A24 [Pseudomonas sp. FRB 230]